MSQAEIHQNKASSTAISRESQIKIRPSATLHNLMDKFAELSAEDQRRVLEDMKEFHSSMDELALEFKILAGKKGKGLQVLCPQSVEKLIAIVAEDEEEAEELKKQTSKGNFKKLARAVRENLENPDKVYEIAEVFVEDPSLSERTKNRINLVFSRAGSILGGFRAIISRIERSGNNNFTFTEDGTRSGDIQDIAAKVISFADALSQPIDRSEAAKSFFVESGKVVDLFGGRVIVQKIEELHRELVDNTRIQGDARKELFLASDKPDSRKYLKIKTELLELEYNEGKLKEQLESYQKAAAAMAA